MICKERLSDMSELSKGHEEIKLSIYKEELTMQNEELRRINIELKSLQNEYADFFIHSPIAYLIIDKNLLILRHNNKATEFFQEIDYTKLHMPKLIDPNSQDAFYFFIRNLVNGKSSDEVEIHLCNPSNTPVRLIGQVLNPDGKHWLQLAILDITRETQYYDAFKKLSYTDALTGLHNRRFFDLRIHELSHDISAHPLGLIIIDVNGLKLFNDAFGHFHGDQLIQETARLLKRLFVDESVIPCRTGGDEFCIIYPNTTQSYLNYYKKALLDASKHIRICDLSLSIAIGEAIKQEVQESMDSIVQTAEDRMYSHKLHGHALRQQQVLQGMLKNFHYKHPIEKQHARHVSMLASLYGKTNQMSSESIQTLKIAGLLHDIGKIALDYDVLDYERELTTLEYDQIVRHPEIGYRILSSTGTFGDISDIILMHHERVDGKGYPQGLHGRDIHPYAKIINICDAFDSMLYPRPYHEPLSVEDAIDELQKNKGTQFDAQTVDTFIQTVLPIIKEEKHLVW